MTPEHWNALIAVAGAKPEKEWSKLPEGRTMTLHVASNGAGFSVTRIESVRLDGPLVRARTVKSEEFVLALQDVYAGAVESPPTGGRKAGFV